MRLKATASYIEQGIVVLQKQHDIGVSEKKAQWFWDDAFGSLILHAHMIVDEK